MFRVARRALQSLKNTVSQTSFRRVSSSPFPHNFVATTRIKASAIVGAGVFASATVYHLTKKSTHETPISGLKLLYAERFQDEEKRRTSGIIPADLVKAAKIALLKNNNQEACAWYVKLTLVHPLPNEMDLYKEAAEFLFKHNYIHEAVKLWQYSLNSSGLAIRLIQAGNVLLDLNKIDEAVAYFEMSTTSDQVMADYFDNIGNLCNTRGDEKRAVYYWEMAESKGSNSFSTLMHLSHHYIKSIHPNGIQQASTKLRKLLKTHSPHSLNHNELGVALYMNAITSKDEKVFYQQRLSAISNFEAALELDPTNDTAAKNLAIAKTLNNRPIYGRPHEQLKPVLDKPTSMYDAIYHGLTENCVETRASYILGANLLPSLILSRSTHAPNELALNELVALKMRWDADELHKKSTLQAKSSDLPSTRYSR